MYSCCCVQNIVTTKWSKSFEPDTPTLVIVSLILQVIWVYFVTMHHNVSFVAIIFYSCWIDWCTLSQLIDVYFVIVKQVEIWRDMFCHHVPQCLICYFYVPLNWLVCVAHGECCLWNWPAIFMNNQMHQILLSKLKILLTSPRFFQWCNNVSDSLSELTLA